MSAAPMQRARDAAAAAEHDHQKEADRERRADRFGHHDAEKRGVDRAAEPRERARIGEGENLIAACRNAEHFGGEFVVANRFERAARATAQAD